MEKVGLGEIFDNGVVDAKCESGLESFLFPEVWCRFYWIVAKRSKFCTSYLKATTLAFFRLYMP